MGQTGARVEEIVLNIRKPSSGKEVKKEDSVDLALERLFKATQETLTTIRFQGFGINLLSSIPQSLVESLTSHTTFEISPVDAAYGPKSAGLLTVLHYSTSLKNLIVQPRSRKNISLEELPFSDLNFRLALYIASFPLLELVRSSIEISNTISEGLKELLGLIEKLRSTSETPPQAAHLESLSFPYLSFSPNIFLELINNSLTSLTSLNFTSIIVSGETRTNHRDFFTVLSLLLAPQPLEFTWEAGLIDAEDIDFTLVPEEPFWEFLGRCTKLRKLSLLTSLVFPQTPLSTSSEPSSLPVGATSSSPRLSPSARSKFHLPRDLEELHIGSASIESNFKRFGWWVRRIEHLVSGILSSPSKTTTKKGRKKKMWNGKVTAFTTLYTHSST
ncbi:uncharacterized protein JCM6883_003829 [Sporobolomyces salmoneus]|uniref:uncharacterized protein n=1 Tax=Sporobolomyces salmoneus TaxID=183962 RepID=UPI00316C88FB